MIVRHPWVQELPHWSHLLLPRIQRKSRYIIINPIIFFDGLITQVLFHDIWAIPAKFLFLADIARIAQEYVIAIIERVAGFPATTITWRRAELSIRRHRTPAPTS